MEERRRHSREHFELRGYNLYRDENWLPIPQRVIKTVILLRSAKGLWAPQYPARKPVALGDDVAYEILLESRESA